jgi:Domain of unknown function (DUF6249)
MLSANQIDRMHVPFIRRRPWKSFNYYNRRCLAKGDKNIETFPRLRQSQAATERKHMAPFMALLLPILAVVLTLTTVMLAIYLGYRKKKEMFTLYHQERMAAIERGIEVPPIPEAFFMSPPTRPGRDLLKGLVWSFIGAAITIALYNNGEKDEALFGLIPLGIGLAYLIYYAIEGRRGGKPPEPDKKVGPGTAPVSAV